MTITKIFCGIVITFTLFTVCFTDSSSPCITPKNQNGECRAIFKCSSLLAILQNRPINSQNADLLKRSRCGSEENLTKVCCPSDNQTNNTSTTPSNLVKAKPADSPLLPTAQVCGIGNTYNILGGKIADIDDFPWMALIEYERNDSKPDFRCGGVLINSRYVLTAAHCVKTKLPERLSKIVSVRLGEYNTENTTDCTGKGVFKRCSPTPLDIPVEEYIPHEDFEAYDVNRYHDIALLRLTKDVSFSVFVKPICLPTTEFIQSKTAAGEKVWVAGWGRTENETESPVKLKLVVPILDPANCSLTYRNEAGVNLDGSQLCAGGEKAKDSCGGDSGGPLMNYYANSKGEINWYSIGIVSFGPMACGKEGWPGIYTRVAEYMPWIVSKLRP